MKKHLLFVVIAILAVIGWCHMHHVFGSEELEQCSALAQTYLSENSKSIEDQKFYDNMQYKLGKVKVEKRSGKFADMFYAWAYGVDFDSLTQADRVTICRYLVFCVRNAVAMPDALKGKLTVDQFSLFLAPSASLASSP